MGDTPRAIYLPLAMRNFRGTVNRLLISEIAYDTPGPDEALGYPFRAAIAAGASTSYPSSRNSTPGINQWERMKTDNHALTLTYALNPNISRTKATLPPT